MALGTKADANVDRLMNEQRTNGLLDDKTAIMSSLLIKAGMTIKTKGIIFFILFYLIVNDTRTYIRTSGST